MNVFLSFVLGMFVLFSVTCITAADGEHQSAVIQPHRSKFQEVYDRVAPVHICGKIVDLEGNPVPEAAVKISWSRADFFNGVPANPTVIWIKSDVRGEWLFSLNNPDCIYVMDVTKEGYEFVRSDYTAQDLVSLCRRTKREPVVLQLRRKGEETFLITSPRASQNDKVLRLTSFHSGTNHLDVLADGIGRGAFKGYADVSFVADYDLNSGWWKITYSATNESDGIVVSDELLHEAPLKGYEKKIVVNGPPWPKFIFLKSRIPAIFSRIALDYYVWDGAPTNRVLSIYYKSWTNPYGDRSLEHSKIAEQNWQVEKELEAEARAAIKGKKHPSKPDISQRIKAMNDKQEKDKVK